MRSSYRMPFRFGARFLSLLSSSRTGPAAWDILPALRLPAVRDWPAIAAALLFAAPGLVLLWQTSWSTEQGAHGPVVLALGLWLLWHEGGSVRPEPGRSLPALLIGVPALMGYFLAHLSGVVWAVWLFTTIALFVFLYLRIGGAAMRALWFPLVYLLAAVPPPMRLVAALTRALVVWLSSAAVEILHFAGFLVVRDGVDIYIDQYELRMADACAGLNSLFGLFAIGMFYIYMRHRADWRYALLLAFAVPPIAILANLGRIILLMLAIRYGGEDMIESAFHPMAGFFMFTLALLMLVGLDALLAPVRRRLSRR